MCSERTKTAPLSPKCHPVPVRVWEREVVCPYPEIGPGFDDDEIRRTLVRRTKIERAVNADIRIQQLPHIDKTHSRPAIACEGEPFIVVRGVQQRPDPDLAQIR